jgi:transcriptional regulator with XRE-family HTH domain
MSGSGGFLNGQELKYKLNYANYANYATYGTQRVLARHADPAPTMATWLKWPNGPSRIDLMGMGQDAFVPGPTSADSRAMLDFGVYIEALRSAAGWSRAQVCGWSGGRLAYSTLAGIENGHRAPGDRTMSALAAGLGVAEDALARLWHAVRAGSGDSQLDEQVQGLRREVRRAAEQRGGSSRERLVGISEQLASAQATIAALAQYSPPPPIEASLWDDNIVVARQMSAPADRSPERRKAARPLPAPAPMSQDELADELMSLARYLPEQDLQALVHIAQSLARRVGSQESSHGSDDPGRQ